MRKVRDRRYRREGFHLSKRQKATLVVSAGAMAIGTAATQGSAQPEIAIAQAVVPERQPASAFDSSDALKTMLMHHEGVRNTVYRDVLGLPTVGVGHLVHAEDGLSVGDTISDDRVLDLLENDLALAEEAVERMVGDLPLHQHEFDALVDLVFAIGEGNAGAAKSPRLHAAIAAGDYEAIAAELATYTQAGGAEYDALVRHAERRQAIFAQNDYADPAQS